MKNKKAQSFNIMNMAIWRMIFLIALFFTVRQFAVSRMQTTIDVTGVKSGILEDRLFYSGAITVVDYDTGRIHADVIDLNKFKDENSLENYFDYNESKISAMLELTNLETEETTKLYLNKDWYDRWEPLSSFKGYSKRLSWRYVTIDTGQGTAPGLLRAETVMSGG